MASRFELQPGDAMPIQEIFAALQCLDPSPSVVASDSGPKPTAACSPLWGAVPRLAKNSSHPHEPTTLGAYPSRHRCREVGNPSSQPSPRLSIVRLWKHRCGPRDQQWNDLGKRLAEEHRRSSTIPRPPVLHLPARDSIPVLRGPNQPGLNDVEQRILRLSRNVCALEEPHRIVGSRGKEALPITERRVHSSGQEAVEVLEEARTSTLRISKDQMVVVTQHHELVELNRVASCCKSQRVPKNLTGDRIGSQQQPSLTTTPGRKDDITRVHLSG